MDDTRKAITQADTQTQPRTGSPAEQPVTEQLSATPSQVEDFEGLFG